MWSGLSTDERVSPALIDVAGPCHTSVLSCRVEGSLYPPLPTGVQAVVLGEVFLEIVQRGI